jgi:protein-tyrosine phosphatase
MAVSGRVLQSDAAELSRLGVTGIVNVTQNPDPVWPSNIDYMQSPTKDDGLPKPTSWFTRVIPFALRHMHNGGKVLIHCEMGINRSPSMAYAVLRATGMDRNKAAQTVMTKLPMAHLRYQKDADAAVAGF